MNANSLVIGLTILFGVLGVLGLVVTLVALKWTAGKRARRSEDDGGQSDPPRSRKSVEPGARAQSRSALLRDPELR